MKRKKKQQDPFKTTAKKKTTKKAQIKVRQERIIDNGMLFTIGVTSGTRAAAVLLSGTPYPQEDVVFYALHFDPPMDPDALRDQQALVRIAYVGKEPMGMGNVSLYIVSPHQKPAVVQRGENVFWVYPTHSLTLDGDGCIEWIEVTLHNAQDNRNIETPILQLVPDLTPFMEEQFPGQYVPQPFYPNNLAILERIGSIDPRHLPQKAPKWKEIRGLVDVTGTRASKRCGFNLPDPDTPQGRNYSPFESEPFDSAARKRMQFGRLREDYIMMCYLRAHPDTVFHQVGWVSHPTRPKWGCSPDGYIEVPEQKTAGALEIKASYSNCNMQDYYYPQVYLEMMCLGVHWAHLVRYSESIIPETRDGVITWSVEATCRVFQVERHKETEERLIQCIVTALKANARGELPRLTASDPVFVALRGLFRDHAQNAKYMTIDTNPDGLRSAYADYINSMQQVADLPQNEPGSLVVALEDRQLDIIRMYEAGEQQKPQFLRMCLEHIQDITQLLMN